MTQTAKPARSQQAPKAEAPKKNEPVLDDRQLDEVSGGLSDIQITKVDNKATPKLSG